MLAHNSAARWWGSLVLAAMWFAGTGVVCAEQNPVIARIGAQTVTGEDFAPYLRAYLRSRLYHAGSPERTFALASEAIDAFLVDQMLSQRAAARDLKIDQALVEKRLTAIVARFSDRAEWPDIEARLSSFRREIEADLRIESLKLEISHVEPPGEAATRKYYEHQRALFTRPAAYRLKLLLISVEPGSTVEAWRAAEAQAQDYRHRIAKGEDFAALARANSSHSSSVHGGAIGLVHQGQLGEAAEMVLHSAKAGAVTGPVRLLEGVALFEVEEKRDPQLIPFDEVKERAASLLEREQAKSQWDDYVKTLRQHYSIDQAAFAAFLANAFK